MYDLHKNEEQLLELVIDYYIKYWTPVGSKALEWIENVEMAPSTIRKYLNFLEKKWLVQQPYNSAWRIPTQEWVQTYITTILSKKEEQSHNLVRIEKKFNLRHFIEILGEKIDWVAFGYYKDEDDINYLWVTKILKKVNNDLEKIIPLMDFIEQKQIISYLSKKEIEVWKINYNFVSYHWINIVLMYITVEFEWIPAVIGTVSSLRVDYKNNIKILNTVLEKWKL